MTQWSLSGPVIALRSAAYGLSFLVISALLLPLYPFIRLRRAQVWAVIKTFARTQLWLLKVICGIRYRVEGMENLPDGPCILASRHESTWETMFLPVAFDLPAVILKQEILSYPIFGPLARKFGFIGVDRSGSLENAKKTFEAARVATNEGRNVLIFPSGTRDPEHRFRVQGGVSVMYRTLKLPCVPIVLNSGALWPYKDWRRYPGVITVRILPPIPPGLRGNEFMPRLTEALQTPIAPEV